MKLNRLDIFVLSLSILFLISFGLNIYLLKKSPAGGGQQILIEQNAAILHRNDSIMKLEHKYHAKLDSMLSLDSIEDEKKYQYIQTYAPSKIINADHARMHAIFDSLSTAAILKQRQPMRSLGIPGNKR